MMKERPHLIRLEQDLEADIAESRRLVEQGRHDAIAELNSHRNQLGGLHGSASREIERYAHNADENLKTVQHRLGELHLLLSNEELEDVTVLDHLRDMVVAAMVDAEDDMENLKQSGDEWSARASIIEAWSKLSRRLALVRIHLVQEVETVNKEFSADRLGRLTGADDPEASPDGLRQLPAWSDPAIEEAAE